MLFNYRYVNHSIERFQEYLDHLVKEVWCKATGEFSLDLLMMICVNSSGPLRPRPAQTACYLRRHS
jgi:hypothetical protein